jgi:hypothetical protein
MLYNGTPIFSRTALVTVVEKMGAIDLCEDIRYAEVWGQLVLLKFHGIMFNVFDPLYPWELLHHPVGWYFFSSLFQAFVLLVVKRVRVFIAHLVNKLFAGGAAEECLGEEDYAVARHAFENALDDIVRSPFSPG